MAEDELQALDRAAVAVERRHVAVPAPPEVAAGKQGSNPPQAASRAKTPRQGTQHPLQDETPREAKFKNF